MKQIKFPSIHQASPGKKRGKILKRFFPVLTVATLLILIGFFISFVTGPGKVFKFIFQQSGLKSDDGRVNILLLGNAGGVHDGAYLTDSIVVASYNLKEDKTYLFSIPRDLWLDKLKVKINAVYEIGDEKNQGLLLSEQTMGDILGIPIHYAIRLDFRGFVKAIDEVGGVDLDVERSFQDSLYPIEGRENDLCGFKEEERDFGEDEAKKLNIEPGKKKVLISPEGQVATDSAEQSKGYVYFTCRFETVNFKAGLTHMNGETALKYVRSRMGTNNEGSDFARSRRQQKVIEAFRKKVLSLETLANPTKVKGLIDAFGQSFETDIPMEHLLEFYKLAKKDQKSQSFVIGAGGKAALLTNPPLQDYGEAWVLVPKGGNFNQIHQFVAQVLKGEISEYEATTAARPSDR